MMASMPFMPNESFGQAIYSDTWPALNFCLNSDLLFRWNALEIPL